jgi:hypothetical protein
MDTLEWIDGTLSTPSGYVYPARLNLTVAELRGEPGVESEAISRVELATSVPDGEYRLDYFYSGHHSERVRAEHGTMRAAETRKAKSA